MANETPVWIEFIKDLTSKNNNFISVTVGATGSGKSWANLAIAEMIDPELYLHPERINFSPEDTLKMIRHIGIGKGKPYITEEAGIQIDRNRWYSLYNKIMKYLCQTYRYMNLIALFNVPSVSLIDPKVYQMMDAQWEMIRVDEKKQKAYMKPLLLEFNEKLQKMYYKHLEKVVDGYMEPITEWAIPKPSDRLIEVYEKKKKRFNERLQDDLLLEIEADRRKLSRKKDLTEAQEAYYELRKEGHNNKEACEILGITEQSGSKHSILIKKKGYTLKSLGNQANQPISTTMPA